MSKIYVVQGSCGSYSDYSEWLVLAYHDKQKATDHAAIANTLNNSLQTFENSQYQSEEFLAISKKSDEMRPPPALMGWQDCRDWYDDPAHPERKEANDAYTAFWDNIHATRSKNPGMNMLDPTYASRAEWQNWPENYIVVEVEVAE